MFRSSNIPIWLSRLEGKQILKLCETHIEKIVETVKGMKQVTYCFCSQDFDALEEAFKRTFDLERAADDVKHAILNELSKGPLHPIDREEVIRLILTADDIAANAKAAARKLRMASIECITDEIKMGLQEMADRDVEIVEQLRDAFMKLRDSPEAAVAASEQVEILEEGIDDCNAGLFKLILKCADEVQHLGPWLMLREALDNMEEVSDCCEDTADVIRSIAILR